MSKIAITGHMSVLGKSLFDKLSIDHTVIGYDIKIGHDLNTCCEELDKHTKAVLSHSDRLCRVVSVSPTWLTNSELVNPPSGAKLLNVDDVSDIIIDMVVEKPQHIELSELIINTLC